MTYPGGAPGGYPGQGPQQPTMGYAPTPAGPKLELAQILHLAVAGLGVLNLFLGFAPLSSGVNFYEAFSGWIPGLLLLGGLLSLPVILPGDKKVGLTPPAIILSVVLAYLFMIFSIDGSLKAGGVMVLIFGILQAGAAVAAFLFDNGIIKPPQPAPANPYGQPGGYNPPSAPFQQQHQQQAPFGQPQQPQAQQPQQPQQTFAPPPGQFGQAPGTPPGGYPQQG
ncbi:hypothetical protein SAMN05192558_12240 [Actinokineospora alba]|uniref:34 kDa antigenic protein n=1 Tax=Actinokineospora alba TaxID=504798 RepID=A0A1H0WKP6_9PSEU|nr:DUF5336 domain-containing protein [Actinokineospora alba]TDP65402.1 hypothetical protein C8E96_0884 [Actinokineospora alba]SDH61498.1 hypothetical protein SAMN05421871_101706 [Actinokineospora alba]SDP90836.1 hypothetical protein SAMN05192558_12240 [Actinokineospora alba]